MDQETRPGGTERLTGEPRDPAQIREDIERTREELGETVEALARKTDVKSRAKEKAEAVKESVREKVPDSAGEAAGQATSAARSNPVPVAALAAFALGVVVGRATNR